MVRLSTLATSTFTSALKVLSTVLPDSTFFSLERTTAPPLPGLWCWNQMTCQSWPSRLSTMPFFRSFVVAMLSVAPSLSRSSCWGSWAVETAAAESSRERSVHLAGPVAQWPDGLADQVTRRTPLHGRPRGDAGPPTSRRGRRPTSARGGGEGQPRLHRQRDGAAEGDRLGRL